MKSILSGIYDLITIGLVSGGILLFAGEIRLQALKKASQGTGEISSFTTKMTGSTLDLSNTRVYGKTN